MLESRRFELVGSQFQPAVLIADFDWYLANEAEITKGLREGQVQGAVINFATEQERMMFLLRWA